ncbi:TonB-dependent receptor [Novacetimonas pomaceti]|uniref:TonB-dependent receptor n=2 Tax=Novacetimonas pomaceti TaxID=2021998 RepID=A0ABX5P8F2_9PROT|nr:TonB-dependent receptor [Novacetimonas pomaceti]
MFKSSRRLSIDSRYSRFLLAYVSLGVLMWPQAYAQAQTVASKTTDNKVTVKKSKKKATTNAGSTSTTATSTGAAAVSQAQTDASANPPSRSENIVVTGSLLHDPNLQSASPITHITAGDMQKRGIKTVTDALQLLASNGSGNLTNAFSANGAFAGGASAPSLRGLSTDSTLVLMDGQRLSYYPLSDDGERNFVDTNWMPSSIMQTIDVMNDGGSATYGADAVAGVINFITRKEIQGFEGNAEGGVSQRGDAGHQRLYATYGHGDLERDGYNFYINSEYQQDDALYNRQVGYPYSSSNLTGIGGTNGDTNALGADGSIQNFGATTTPVVRPSDGGNSGTGAWQLLNPSAGCARGKEVSGYVTGTPAGSTSTTCTVDSVHDYSQIAPSLRRIEATAHFTANVTSHSQLTAMFTYSQALSQYSGDPLSYDTVRNYTQSELANTLSVPIPAYLPNGQLNPNDPYASQGKAAEMEYAFAGMVPRTSQYSQNFRGSVRYNGSAHSNWGSDWKYDANFVGMNTDLQQTITGVPTINGIEDAIINGTYNFLDPSANSKSVLNSIAPKNVMNAQTQEYSGEVSLSKGLFRLPGGMVDLAIGANVRYESLNDPSANQSNPADPGAQYAGYINPFYAYGSRWVESGFFEVGIPIVKMLNVDVSGRYDHYSEGYSHFSPKVGVNFKPVKQFTLRGTFSRGFRVPSFAETGGANVGYVTYTIQDPAWHNQHLNSNGTADSYAQAYSMGLNTSGNPDLKPEISTNFTGGAVIRPLPWLSLTADYYYIKKSNYIAPNPVSYDAVAEDYVEGKALPAGVTVTPDVVDTLHPNAPVRPGIINMGYVNTNKLTTDGVDLHIDASRRLPGFLHNIRWYSRGEATYVRSFNLTLPDGQVEHFAGTEGPWEITSASGTPRWRANWQNTFSWRNLSVTPTVYYTSGYKTVAEDATGPGTRGSCANSVTQYAQTFAPQGQCHVKNYWDVDLTVNYNINRRWSVYANVYNLLGFRSPYDYGTYGSYLYNSSWSQKGVIYRSFQFGVNVKL